MGGCACVIYMYDVSAPGVDERIINVHCYNYSTAGTPFYTSTEERTMTSRPCGPAGSLTGYWTTPVWRPPTGSPMATSRMASTRACCWRSDVRPGCATTWRRTDTT